MVLETALGTLLADLVCEVWMTDRRLPSLRRKDLCLGPEGEMTDHPGQGLLEEGRCLGLDLGELPRPLT